MKIITIYNFKNSDFGKIEIEEVIHHDIGDTISVYTIDHTAIEKNMAIDIEKPVPFNTEYQTVFRLNYSLKQKKD